MPRPALATRIAIFLLAIFWQPPEILSEGNVGCLFSEKLCFDDEWCYDDTAFGRCLKPMGDVDEEDLYRYELEREGLHELSSELRRLFALGYRWSHGYTQCRLQSMLYSLRNDLTFEPDSCSHLSDNDLEGALKALEGQVDIDPRELAIIKYTPSEVDPHGDFADEVYYPPIDRDLEREEARRQILNPNAIELDMPDPYADYTMRKRAWYPQRRWIAPIPYPFESRKRSYQPDALEFLTSYDNNEIPNRDFGLRAQPLTVDDMKDLYPEIKFLSDLNLTPAQLELLISPKNYNKFSKLVNRIETQPRRRTYDVEDLLKQQLDAEKELEELQNQERLKKPVVFGNEKFRQEEKKNRDEPDSNEEVIGGKTKFYTEGGVVGADLVDGKDEDAALLNSKLFASYELPERLDMAAVDLSDLNLTPAELEILTSPKYYHTLVKLKVQKELERFLNQEIDDRGSFFDDQKDRPKVDKLLYGLSKNDEIESSENEGKFYAEGGLVSTDLDDGRDEFAETVLENNLDKLFEKYNMGFKRPERLDVKKPGPPFDSQISDASKYVVNDGDHRPNLKKKPDAKDEEYDDSFVHIELKHGIKSWKQGEDILKTISHVLDIQPEMLSHQMFKPYSISFKVEQNSRGVNASDLSRRIARISNILKNFEGVDVMSVAFGDEQNLHSIVSYPSDVKKKDNSSLVRPPLMKKEPRGIHPHSGEMDAQRDNDMDHIYVEFSNDLKNWKQGSNIITNISNLLRLERSDLSEGKVRSNYVSFKVNSRILNATEVARGIEANRYRLEELTGVQITSIGIGNKESLRSITSIPFTGENVQMYTIILMACGILISIIMTTALLILIRKHIKAKEKLHSLSRPDAESSKEIVKTKTAVSGKAGDSIHGRITSLSRESEQSPSSRSSTSSWSEEPVFHNMDISTGHMVLSYMEDHLKNKDRLEQEWVALCAYVAEPCEASVAKRKDNVDKNRYPEILPYDHARIVLNELSNATSSDYINASSITDHDPRNPAYIATQGPLPNTTPDFWQLIWEQGAVVIVMLTRLTEGGTAMCHRYWPEEGSEVYHIYEVHLVSEHIWCDDYLVRSFYLKNIRTGETRTVTQFHFLSWPESGVPTSTKALLEFRRKVNKSYRGRSCPIVVHCSDGSGRTGTYALIDMVLSRMAKGAKEIDIAATLEHLRDQRPKMVSTKQQFEFVLTAVAEEVHAILKALPPQATPVQEKEK